MSTREVPQPIDPNFRIELPSFEGPLDLLVHLIGKHELDILDLPISFVTERYLAYIGMMKQLNLDVASEYLVMAAELARIKSKMLLPQSPDDDEEENEEEIDPRAELIRRLLEFQKYKRAGEQLGSRAVAGRDVFYRGVPAPEAEGPAPLAEVSIFKLLDALQKVIDRAKADVALEVSAERISIQERMTEIAEWLTERRGCRFEELFQGAATTYHIVVTFLAMLEMAKERLLRVYQPDNKSEIHLEYRVLSPDAPTIPPEEGDEVVAGPEIPQAPPTGVDSLPAAEDEGAGLDLSAENVQDPAPVAQQKIKDESST